MDRHDSLPNCHHGLCLKNQMIKPSQAKGGTSDSMRKGVKGHKAKMKLGCSALQLVMVSCYDLVKLP